MSFSDVWFSWANPQPDHGPCRERGVIQDGGPEKESCQVQDGSDKGEGHSCRHVVEEKAQQHSALGPAATALTNKPAGDAESQYGGSGHPAHQSRLWPDRARAEQEPEHT